MEAVRGWDLDLDLDPMFVQQEQTTTPCAPSVHVHTKRSATRDPAAVSASPVPSTRSSPAGVTGPMGASETDAAPQTSRGFRSRRPATTKYVQLNPKALPATRCQVRGVDGFFPPVKLKEHYFTTDLKRKRFEMRTPPFIMELAPEEAALWTGDIRTRSHLHSALSMTPPVYPHVTSDAPCDDLTSMPRPRMMVSRGELPWVFRQKVKRSMNELSKIMASRPPQSIDASSTFGYRLDH